MSNESTVGGFMVGAVFGIIVGFMVLMAVVACTERPMVPADAKCSGSKVIAYTPHEWPQWQCREVMPR